MNSSPQATRSLQGGMVLMIVLVFALLLNLLAATVIQSAALQSRMAGNITFHLRANAIGESVLKEVASRGGVFPIGEGVGYTSCSSAARRDCDDRNLLPPQQVDIPQGVQVDFFVVRRAPYAQWIEEVVHDPNSQPMTMYREVALFELGIQVDTPESSLGRSHILGGYAVPLSGDAPWLVYWREPAVDPL